MIEFNDFLKIDIRVGEVVEAEAFPEIRNPSYKLKIDFGKEIGVKKTSAQITHLYDLKDLVGKQVMAVTNFPPKQIGPIMSEVLILGFSDQDGHIVLAQPQQNVPLGSKLH